MIEVRKAITKSGRGVRHDARPVVRGNGTTYEHSTKTGKFGIWVDDIATGHTYVITLQPDDVRQLIDVAQLPESVNEVVKEGSQ